MSIVRVRSADVDNLGDPVGSESRATLTGAFTAPRTSNDVDGKGRSGAVIGLTLFAPHGSDLVRTDSVEVEDEPYRIVGDVADWTHGMTGWRPGVTCALERAEG